MNAPMPKGPVRSAAAWRGPDLARDASWIWRLDDEERNELRRAAEALAGVPLDGVRRESFDLPRVGRLLRRWRTELRDGRGFVLVRGMPIDRLDRAAAARLYWLLGTHLGDTVPQNGQGEVLCDVRDTGADPLNPDTRLYTTRAEQDFHTDGADIIGLLCLRGAKAGGASRIVSSVTVYNELVARRADLAPLLFEPWCFRLHGNMPPGFPAHFEMPICRWDGTHLSTFFIAWYIRRAQFLLEVPKLTPAQEEALALVEQIANDPALYLDMQFEPGDVQWLKNSVILHKRTEYEDHAEPERKRHLLRLWLAARDFEDGDELLRGGMNGGAHAATAR